MCLLMSSEVHAIRLRTGNVRVPDRRGTAQTIASPPALVKRVCPMLAIEGLDGSDGIRGTRGVPCARGKRRGDHHRRCFDVLGQRSSGWGGGGGPFEGGGGCA